MTIKWQSRAQWRAAAPKGDSNPTPIHVYGLSVHWSGGNVGNDLHATCAQKVRAIQRYHQQTKGWSDIAYSFLVCQHGSVYVGRGTSAGPASEGTKQGNSHYWSVCWLGGPTDVPSLWAREAIVDLRTYLQQRGMGLKVRAHQYFVNTACPGPRLATWLLSRWPDRT